MVLKSNNYEQGMIVQEQTIELIISAIAQINSNLPPQFGSQSNVSLN
jgi:hypothetical protein